MQLLCFAHKNEASSFLQNLDFSKKSSDLFVTKDKSLALAVIGEGIWNSLFRLPKILHEYPISAITNLGCAGLLRQDLPISLEKVYQVRCVFGEKVTTEVQFQSFTLTPSDLNSLDGLDCISAMERVKDKAYQETLSRFAPIVDRELWAMARVAKEFSVPISSYKYISDLANSKDICQQVMSSYIPISDSLYETWAQIDTPQKSVTTDTLPSQLFHMSTYQKKLWDKSLQSLRKKFEEQSIANILNEQLGFEKIKKMNISKKERSKILLQQAYKILNPYQNNVSNKISRLLEAHQDTAMSVKVDNNLDKTGVYLQLYIKDEQHRTQLIEKLQGLPIDQINQLLEGSESNEV